MPFETRLTPEMIERFTKSGHWGKETFYDLLSAEAARHPERIAVVDAKSRVSYGELLEKVERSAAFLRKCGIGRGDVVTIQLPNWVEFAYVFFALELLGAVANKISPDFRSREVDYILRFSKSRAYVSATSFKGFDYPAMVRALKPRLPELKLVCVIDGVGGGDTLSLVEGLRTLAPLPLEERVRMDANEVYRMAFTSGTTGNPKCVLHSFNTTLSAVRFMTRDMRASQDDVSSSISPSASIGAISSCSRP